MQTRWSIALLIILAYVLTTQIILAETLTVDQTTCAVLQDGGHFYDRYQDNVGDVYDATGARVATAIRAETILKSCYGLRGVAAPAVRMPVECSGCALRGTRAR